MLRKILEFFSEKLPVKPSKLIKLALSDLEKCEKEGLIIDMAYWLTPCGNTYKVCLGGAVMYQTLNMRSKDRDSVPLCTTGKYEDRLRAINLLRQGCLDSAAKNLGFYELTKKCKVYKNIKITEYSINPFLFKTDMLNLASMLEKIGY